MKRKSVNSDMKIKQEQINTLKKLCLEIRRYWMPILISLILATGCILFTLYIPILSGNAIDHIVAEGKVDFIAVYKIIKKIIMFMIMAAVFQWSMNLCNNYIAYHILYDLRDQAMRKIEILPLKFIDTHSYGDIVNRIISDADQLAEGMLMVFNQLFTGVVTILGTLLFLFLVNYRIALVVMLLTPFSLFVANFIATKTYEMFQLMTNIRGEQTSFIDEMIGNLKMLQVFSYDKKALERFDEKNERLEQHTLKAVFYSSITNPSTRFINGVVYAGVGLVGALSVISNGMTVGQLACVLNYARQYAKPFNEITSVITEFQNALACADRIFKIIEKEPQTPEAQDAVECSKADGSVEIENINFSYDPDRPLIKNFNLSVKPGQRIAIVGPTGCGKTTFINLLMRFYDIDSGKIYIDDNDISTLTRKSLRRSYGMVLQETWIKTGTIRENIAIGKQDATQEEIIQAAKESHAHNFIRRLPNGYDTVICESDGMLSEGQKQLLCITRVMLCCPPMLILDEATSSIDIRTEMKIQQAFARMMEGRTSFIVAHRLSTIQETDIILVMKQGNIIEKGKHDELLRMNGFYSRMYNSQFEH